jgi:uncharacterized protein YraI
MTRCRFSIGRIVVGEEEESKWRKHKPMKKLSINFYLVVVFAAGIILNSSSVATAQSVTFTVRAESAFLHSGPSLSTPRTDSVFQGQTFTVIGRTADASWLRLDYVGFASEEWILASVGEVKGAVAGLPVTAGGGPVSAPTVGNGNPPPAPVLAPGFSSVRYTVIIQSMFARSAPSLTGSRVQSLFAGQTFTVRAKSADGFWLQIDFPFATTETWVQTIYGKIAGDLASIPFSGEVAAPSVATTSAPVSIPVGEGSSSVGLRVSPYARAIYQYGLTLGNNPRSFSKVGDCLSLNPFFLTAFDNSQEYELGGRYAYLQETINQFTGSFSRPSQAARLGFSNASLFMTMWADPVVCTPGEGPLACELRLHRPSIVFISLGTNGAWQTDADYEAGMRRIIEMALAQGVVPIVSTKADDVEGGGRFNRIVSRLASEYDIPLWDFRQAVQVLPDSGLLADGYHLTWGPAYFDTPENLQTGWQWRNLTALQMLDAVWRAVR